MKVLVTGGAGFIGSNFIHYALEEHADWKITNLDKLTYAGNLENLKYVEKNPNYYFIKGDIADRDLIDKLLSQSYDALINFAAESHVDRSILDCTPFLETNVRGTQILLEGAKKHRLPRFLQVSTDEVYGSVSTGCSTEQSNLQPTSPYAASKASADLLCMSYRNTHGTPVVITRGSNNLGPYQFPEKLIPLVVTNALENKPVPVYGDGQNIRDWIFVIDHCRGIDTVLQKGRLGEIYNISARNGRTNLEVITGILDFLGKPRSLIQFVSDRPGHDRRYAMDGSKATQELDWKPYYSFEKSLETTVKWYLDNRTWWERIKRGEYAEYYERMYTKR
jgi:dTDP-glucose 4,6-dehydratase